MRVLVRIRFFLMRRLHPELTRVSDQKDREWALWFALESAPAWQRIASIALVLMVGPTIAISTTVMACAYLHIRPYGAWPFVLFGAWLVGVVIAAVALESFRGRGAGRNCYRALRVFGYDVCQHCGYDMTGHPPKRDVVRMCPECGEAVSSPPLIHSDASPPRDQEK